MAEALGAEIPAGGREERTEDLSSQTGRVQRVHTLPVGECEGGDYRAGPVPRRQPSGVYLSLFPIGARHVLFGESWSGHSSLPAQHLPGDQERPRDRASEARESAALGRSRCVAAEHRANGAGAQGQLAREAGMGDIHGRGDRGDQFQEEQRGVLAMGKSSTGGGEGGN